MANRFQQSSSNDSEIVDREALLRQFQGRLKTSLIIGLVLSFFIFWIFSSYFRVDVPSSLMFQANDGWCEAPKEGIGIHCFGDFNERVGLPPGHPWKDYVETSPAGPIVTSIANVLLAVTSPQISLITFLLIYMICVATPVLIATRTRRPIERLELVLLLSIGTYPSIVVFDRGHSLALAVPLMYLYLTSALRDDSRLLSISIVALSCLKPVFIGLSLIFLILNRGRRFTSTLLLSLSCPAALLVLTGKGDVSRIHEWLEISRSYTTTFREVSQANPPNASVGAAIYMFADLVAGIVRGDQTEFLDVVARSAHIVSLIVACFIIVCLYSSRRRTSPVVSALVLLIVFSLFVGKYVGPYYLVIAIAVNALIFSSSAAKHCSWDLHRGLSSMLLLPLISSCAPLLIPVLPSNWYELQVSGAPITVKTLNVSIAVTFWVIFCMVVVTTGLRKYSDDD